MRPSVTLSLTAADAVRLAILSRGPAAYWPLDDAGATAIDVSGNGRHGAYSAGGVVQAQAVGPFVCPTFDGAAGHVNVWSESLRDAFDGSRGTLLAFLRPGAPGVSRTAVRLSDGDAAVWLGQTSANLRRASRAGALGTPTKTVAASTFPAGWTMLALTWDVAADTLTAFYDGALAGTQSGIGAWGGPLNPDHCVIGAQTTNPVSPWLGEVAHVALFTAALGPADIATINAASGL